MRCYICNREADDETDDGFPICYDCQESVEECNSEFDEDELGLFDYIKNENKNQRAT